MVKIPSRPNRIWKKKDLKKILKGDSVWLLFGTRNFENL